MMNKENYTHEPAKAYGVLIGCAVGTFFLIWGFDAFVTWWSTSKDSIGGFLHTLLYLTLIAVSVIMLVAVGLIPYQSVKLSDRFSSSSGKRFIVFGAIGIVLFAVLFFTTGKNIELLIGVVYFAIIFVKGILIAKGGRA